MPALRAYHSSMNRLLAILLVLTSLVAFVASAQSPDEQYLRIYGLIQAGDQLNQSGERTGALKSYLEAQSHLQRLQKVFPDWSPKVVNFRLDYLDEKITALSANAAPSPSSRLEASAAFGAPPPTLSEADQQLSVLEDEVRQLQAEKIVLEAKLKEAFATQPATIDPRELARAEERVQSLTKENELLKVALSTQQAVADPAATEKSLAEARQSLSESRLQLAQQMERANALALEKEALDRKLAALAEDGSAAQLRKANRQLDDANARIAEQTERVNALASEKSSLQARVDTLASAASAAEALRAENELLKKQVSELKSSLPSADEVAAQQTRLTQAQAGIAALQSELEILRLEKSALEAQVGKIAASRDDDARLIQELRAERDELKKQLASKPKSGFLFWRRNKDDARVQELTDQVNTFRARLEALEARAVPYTAEELSLLEKPAAQLAASDASPSAAAFSGPPPGTGALAAEAQSLFRAKQFAAAEQKYLEILQKDENNVYTLGNLAAIQLEMGRLSEAETNVKRALTLVPDDAYALTILGYLKFRQEQYDAAFDALSRAAKLDPKNPEIQNYLGVTLSHKGMREPAEAALRKAIQLDPNYASAHNNLAVYYATQKPPLMGLARWHYNRAVSLGHPRNPELEKLIGLNSPNASSGTP